MTDDASMRYLQARVYREDGDDLFAWIEGLPTNKFRRRAAIVEALRTGVRALAQSPSHGDGADERPSFGAQERSPSSSKPKVVARPTKKDAHPEPVVSPGADIPVEDLHELFGSGGMGLEVR